jgi:Leucine-rich repeat (LRR) protein
MDNIIIKGPFGEVHLSRYEDVLSYPNSHQIHYLSIPSNIVIEEIVALPPNLQIFRCCNNKLKKLPYLPSTIRHIFVKTNKIEEFPIIKHCCELEELNLNDNYICEIDTERKNRPYRS